MEPVVHHTTNELRKGLRSALDGAITPQLRAVEGELRLAGFLTDANTVTTAGRRFLDAPVCEDGSRLAAA